MTEPLSPDEVQAIIDAPPLGDVARAFGQLYEALDTFGGSLERASAAIEALVRAQIDVNQRLRDKRLLTGNGEHSRHDDDEPPYIIEFN